MNTNELEKLRDELRAASAEMRQYADERDRYADANLRIKAQNHALRAELVSRDASRDAALAEVERLQTELAETTESAVNNSRSLELSIQREEKTAIRLAAATDLARDIVANYPDHTLAIAARAFLAAQPAAPAPEQTCDAMREANELRLDRERRPASDDQASPIKRLARISQIESLRAEVERLRALHGREASERMAAESHLVDATDLVRWILRESTIQGLLRRELEGFLAARSIRAH